MLAIPGYQWIGNNNTNGGDYVGGYPASICLHMTVSSGLSMSYAQSHQYPPHAWANVYTGDKWQSLDLNRSGKALYQPPYTNSYLNRKWYCIQTELVGNPVVNVETYSRQQCDWIGRNVIAPQVQALRSIGLDVNLSNVRYHTDSSGSASEYWHGRMSDAEWAAFDGICAHIDAVGNDHWDCSVERTDLMVESAIAELGGSVGPGPVVDEEEDDMMRYVVQVGGGGKHGPGTIWAISPTEPKAWPIATPYTVSVLQAHGVLMTRQQMEAKKYTFETDGGSITSTYEVMPVLESIPDK
jgi:hypothetical protein